MKQEILNALTLCALKDDSFDIRAQACTVLANTGDPQVVPVLLQILQHDHDPFVRHKAICGLAHYDTPDAIPALINALKDPYFEVRAEAIRQLAHYLQKLDNDVNSGV